MKLAKSYTIIVTGRFAMLAITALVLGSMTVGILLSVALSNGACERQCVQHREQLATEAMKAQTWDEGTRRSATLSEQDKAILLAVGWSQSK